MKHHNSSSETIEPNDPAESPLTTPDSAGAPWALDLTEELLTDTDPPDDLDLGDLSDLSFDIGRVKLQDTSNFERWIQSALKALVAPRLTIDGILGYTTRLALQKFQLHVRRWLPQHAALDPDGIAGARTIVALELATGTQAPKSSQIKQPTPPASDHIILTVVDPATPRYSARLGTDEIRFSTWSKVRKTPDGTEFTDPHNVSRYDGAKVDLLTDADLYALGFSTSGARIFRANALKESGGQFGAVNTYDNQIVSWGVAQFAGHAGTLARLLAELKESPQTATLFDRFFTAHGIDVDYGPYPYENLAKGIETQKSSGWHIVVTDGKITHRGDRGWKFLRTQPTLIAALFLAGNHKDIQCGQARFWRENFLDKALRSKITDDHRFSDYITSEYGLGLGARLFNWMPAWLPAWFRDFAQELTRRHKGRDFLDPATWNLDPGYEETFFTLMKDRRRKEKAGSWDTYGEDLLKHRGSYVT